VSPPSDPGHDDRTPESDRPADPPASDGDAGTDDSGAESVGAGTGSDGSAGGNGDREEADDRDRASHPRLAPESDPPHELSLAFEYADGGTAALVRESVGQEVGEIEGDRTRATVTRDGATVRIHVAAADLVALRAGLNTWCSLVGVADRVLGAGENR